MAVRKVLLVSVILAPIVWGAPMDAASGEIHLRLKYAGNGMSTHRNPNRDAINAGWGVLTCTSNLGRCTAQGVGEAVLAGTATCPNGKAGILLTVLPGTGHGFTWFERTGDFLFNEIVSETVCYDPSTGMQFKSGTSNVTGGTGRFAGATGQLEFEGTQWLLYVDGDGNGFGAQNGTMTGTIIVPQKGKRERKKIR
jgi:hypothetical protein